MGAMNLILPMPILSYMAQDDSINERFREFRETVRRMARASSKEAERHLRQDEVSLEFPFHDGETGSLELALDYLDDIARKETSVSANNVEEAYVSLLLSLKRMKGNVAAMERIIKAMQASFDLPEEAEIDHGSVAG